MLSPLGEGRKGKLGENPAQSRCRERGAAPQICHWAGEKAREGAGTVVSLEPEDLP